MLLTDDGVEYYHWPGKTVRDAYGDEWAANQDLGTRLGWYACYCVSAAGTVWRVPQPSLSLEHGVCSDVFATTQQLLSRGFVRGTPPVKA